MNSLVKERKILISTGFGAGWTSWADDEYKLFALEYQPIIDFLLSGGKFVARNDHFGYERDSTWKALDQMSRQIEQSPNEAEIAQRKKSDLESLWEFEEPGRSVLQRFLNDLRDKFGPEADFYLGGAKGLTVMTVHGRVKIDEYDGFESFVEEGDVRGFI